jgi:mutator protein MutT
MNSINLITAGIILNEQEDKILLIKRTDGMWGDAWSIPGGHIDFGESVQEALLRELKEELNLEVIKTKFLTYEEFIPPGKPNKQFISLNFLVHAKETITPNHEIQEAKWFSFDKMDSLNHKIPQEGMRVIKRLTL